MAVIVRRDGDDRNYALLGTGFGAFKAMRGATLGDILSKHEEGETAVAALCGADGKIVWADSQDVTVVSVDGTPIDQLLT